MKHFLLLALFLSFSFATFGADKDDVKKGEFLKKELNLSDEQLAKVKAIKKDLKPGIRELKKKVFALKKEFKTALKDPKSSGDALTQKFEALHDAKDELNRKRFQMMLKMREILTPEQLQKFHAVKSRMKEKWKEKHKKHRDQDEDQD